MGTITDIEAIAAATLLMGRVEQLATLTEVPGMLVRRSFTPQATEANRLVGAWMREAGMAVRTDAVCNLIGRYEGTTPDAKTLILGSHLDSVRDAGRYDGPLGVLAALACAEHLHRAGRRLPFALEVIAFTDEEGLRFHTSYVGSSAISGAFDPAWLEIADADGITMATAIRSAGGDPTAIRSCRYDPDRVLGYCEAHIEQGPALEDLDLPVGVVSAISSQERATVTFIGVAGHAGTVPMRLRHDALCAAAAFVLAVEAAAAGTPGAVAPARVPSGVSMRARYHRLGLVKARCGSPASSGAPDRLCAPSTAHSLDAESGSVNGAGKCGSASSIHPASPA